MIYQRPDDAFNNWLRNTGQLKKKVSFKIITVPINGLWKKMKGLFSNASNNNNDNTPLGAC